jgi:membrane-associated phospholipid phosphatase
VSHILAPMFKARRRMRRRPIFRAPGLRRRRVGPPIRRPGVVGLVGWLDQTGLWLMRTRAHAEPLEAGMRALGIAGEWAAVWTAIGLGGAAADGSRRGRWLRAAAVGPAAIGANFAVKVAVGRRRPLIEAHPPLARAPSELSFPSAHATSSVAAATALGRVAPNRRMLLYGLATGICLTRPYLGMHYPSDVLAGVVLGALIGRAVPRLDEPGIEERLIDLVASGAGRRAGADGAGREAAGEPVESAG